MCLPRDSVAGTLNDPQIDPQTLLSTVFTRTTLCRSYIAVVVNFVILL